MTNEMHKFLNLFIHLFCLLLCSLVAVLFVNVLFLKNFVAYIIFC
jgi:hypothetical protein